MLRIILFIALILGLPVFGGGDHDHPDAEAWAKAMTPGRPHAELATQAGEWTYVLTMWEGPEAEPMEMSGVSTKTMMMGGRFLKEELLGEFMGRPFRGFGLTGYDNLTGKLTGIWLDNMGTAIHQYVGREEDGVHHYTSEMRDPGSGRVIPTRSTSKTVDRDHHTFESFVILPDGSEFLQMRVEYTRVGA